MIYTHLRHSLNTPSCPFERQALFDFHHLCAFRAWAREIQDVGLIMTYGTWQWYWIYYFTLDWKGRMIIHDSQNSACNNTCNGRSLQQVPQVQSHHRWRRWVQPDSPLKQHWTISGPSWVTKLQRRHGWTTSMSQQQCSWGVTSPENIRKSENSYKSRLYNEYKYWRFSVAFYTKG
jgi:hypothetical protein